MERALKIDRNKLFARIQADAAAGFDGNEGAGVVLICDGCGSRMTDAELIAARAANPKLIACCPERKMVPLRAT